MRYHFKTTKTRIHLKNIPHTIKHAIVRKTISELLETQFKIFTK